MSTRVQDLLRRVRRRIRRRAEIREELLFHLDEEIEERQAAGASGDDARRAARLDLGNVAVIEEDTREAWGWMWLERLAQDARYAARTFRRRPVFAAAAIATLALGLGAATALFSLADALLLRPLPVDRPGDLVRLVERRRESPEDVQAFTLVTYDRLRSSNLAWSDVIASADTFGPTDIEVGGERRSAVVQLVSDSYFDALGVRALGGRVFHRPGPGLSDAPIAVISADYWRSQYGEDPSAIGAHFRRADRDLTIVGIAPRGFRGVEVDVPVDIWLLIDQVVAPNSPDRTQGRWMHVMARLEPGATAQQATVEASGILQRAVVFESGANGFSKLRQRLSQPLLIVSLLVAAVLVIACANLANLTLASTTARERELAIRTAIGASRTRIVHQLLTESFVIAALGGLLALAVAIWISGALLAFLPPREAQALPNLRFSLDVRVLGFGALLTVVASLLVGLAPALSATGSSPADLNTRTGSRGPRWLDRVLLVGQVTLCTGLLVLAGVFVRTLDNLRDQDTGYQEDHLLVADVRPPGRDERRRDAMIEELRARIATLPGVKVAAFSHVGQLQGAIEFPVGLPGQDPLDKTLPSVIEQRISPGFLAAMGSEIVEGRDFTPSDTDKTALVAIVNQSFARRFFPARDPVGARFFRSGGTNGGQLMEIVGVVRDARWVSLRDRPEPMYYRPYAQMGGTPVIRLAIRTDGDPRNVAAAIPMLAKSIDAGIVLTNVVPFSEIVDRVLVLERLMAQVATALSVLALIIAAVGLYGVLAYRVARRRREVGVRLAIGALPRTIEWMFLKESLGLVCAGLGVGLPIAAVGVHFVASMLFGLGRQDPVSFIAAIVTLVSATAIAAYLPARRAGLVDPVVTLRED